MQWVGKQGHPDYVLRCLYSGPQEQGTERRSSLRCKENRAGKKIIDGKTAKDAKTQKAGQLQMTDWWLSRESWRNTKEQSCKSHTLEKSQKQNALRPGYTTA